MLCGTYRLDPSRTHPLLRTLLLYVLRTWFREQPARGASTGWAAALNDPSVIR